MGFLSAFFVPLDFISVILAGYGAYFLRPHFDFVPFFHIPFSLEQLLPLSQYHTFVLLSAFVFVFFQSVFGEYSFFFKGKMLSFWKSFLSVSLLNLSIIAFYALFLVETFFSRGVLYVFSLCILCAVFLSRTLMYALKNSLVKYPQFQKKVYLIGKKENRETVKEALQKDTPYHIFYESDVFTKKDFQGNLDEVWYVYGSSHDDVSEILEFSYENHLQYRFIPHNSDMLFYSLSPDVISYIPVFSLENTAIMNWGKIFKRLFDIIFSLCFLLLFSPVYIFCALAVFLEDFGPIFYVSSRVGKNGKLFPLLKFRSMVKNADALKKSLEKHNERKNSPFFKMKNDPRITRVGAFLRRTSLDETPQFFNVLVGHMSVVGPRPHLEEEIKKYTPSQKRVLSVLPGISGLSQVSGRSDLLFEEEMRLDTHYIVHWNFLLDIKIILKTPWILLYGKGAD
jgi:exopolysaccharide biosynthesis polyprenyl glycosylphosphotransferase